MKQQFIALISLLVVLNVTAQSVDSLRTHQGFHLEFGIGPAFGSIEAEVDDASTESEATFTGTGLAMDLHVGHSISRSIVLTANVYSKYIYSPQIEYNGLTG